MSSALRDAERTSALFADLYQLTMAQAYWHSGHTAEATFSLFFRSCPPDRGYFALAGIEDAVRFLESFSFEPEDIDYLRGLGSFDSGFLHWLAKLRFTGSVRAMAEGDLFFAGEPVIEVTAPIIEAQVAETLLLNQINAQTIFATKASRVVHAARGKTLVDFAARRTHGTDAALKMARAGYMAGFAGTSNVLAGKQYGIPVFGTMAHSFVMAFESEEESFRAYADSFPDATTLLVDTYDTVVGVRNAIRVAQEMQSSGHRLRAVRLDSGDFRGLSHKARALLDEAGLGHVEVFASGGLDEFEVEALVSAGAPIDGFGVGTKVGVSADAPWTDCAYKLVEYDGRPVLKLSSGKQTAPGRKQVFRYSDRDYDHDVIGLADEELPQPDGEPIVREVMRDGERAVPAPGLEQIREHFKAEFSLLPERYKALRSPSRYPVANSANLDSLERKLTQQVAKQELGA